MPMSESVYQEDATTTAKPVQGVRQGVSGVLHDVLTLGELQFSLLSLDAREAAGRLVVPVALLGIAGVFSIAALPLFLIALAQLLEHAAGWPAAAATATAAGAGVLVAAILGFVSYLKLKRIAKPFDRSTEELSRNVSWFKEALRRQQRPDQPVVPNRPR